MKREDFFRYFVLVGMFCVVDLVGVLIGTHAKPYSFDKISISAALITILWAIRDGQKKGDHP